MSPLTLTKSNLRVSIVLLLLVGISFGGNSNGIKVYQISSQENTIGLIELSAFIDHPTVVISNGSTSDSYSPYNAVDSKDNIHIVWEDSTDIDGSGGDSDIFYKMFNASNQTWGRVFVISNESTAPSYAPNIEVDSKDNLHVVWTEYPDVTGDVDIFYKKYDNSTGIWSGVVEISSQTTRDSYNHAIAIDSMDNVHVIWTVVEPTVFGYVIDYRKFDSSLNSWGQTSLLSNETTTSASEPDIAVDSNNDVHVLWVDSTDYGGAGGDKDVIYKKITSSGWSAPMVVSEGSTKTSSYPHMVVDSSNNIHVVWGDSTNMGGSDTSLDEDILYRSYNASTVSWNSVSLLSSESGTTATSAFPDIAIDLNDDLHVVWNDNTNYGGAGTDDDVFLKRYDATAHTWQLTKVVSTESDKNSLYPRIVIDSNANIHIVWEDISTLDLSSDSDIFYKLFEDDNILISLDSPGNVSYELGSTGNELQWLVYDTNADTYALYRNNQLLANNTWTSGVPISVDIDGLAVGTYNYTILVLDKAGNNKVDSITVNVTDTTFPVFLMMPSDFSFINGTSGNLISWLTIDLNPNNYIIYRNGTEFDQGTWLSNTNISISIDDIPVGVHNFTILVTDSSLNLVKDTVIVTNIMMTGGTTSSTSQTTSPSSVTSQSQTSQMSTSSNPSSPTNTGTSEFPFSVGWLLFFPLCSFLQQKKKND